MVASANSCRAHPKLHACVRRLSPVKSVNKVRTDLRNDIPRRTCFFLAVTALASLPATTTTTTTTTIPTSVLTIISSSSPMISGSTSSVLFNATSAPYACDDISLACLAYGAYCAREIEFSGIPCRVLCPRTCNTCKLIITFRGHNAFARRLFARLRRFLHRWQLFVGEVCTQSSDGTFLSKNVCLQIVTGRPFSSIELYQRPDDPFSLSRF